MSITVEWDDADQTIIRVVMAGFWSESEADRAFAECDRLLDAVQHRAGIIVDLRRSLNLSPLAIDHVHQMGKKQHPNAAITVFVGGNMLFLPLGSISRLFRKKPASAFAPTLDAARRIIRNVISAVPKPNDSLD